MEIEPARDWAELTAFGFLVLGFVLAVLTTPQVNYVLGVFAGLIFGRVLYRNKKDWQLPSVLGISGFLIGFIVGAFGADRFLIVALYAIAGVVGYLLHAKGLVSSVEI